MNGKTIEMVTFNRTMRWRHQEPWVQKSRDRSLAGKKRIKARKGK